MKHRPIVAALLLCACQAKAPPASMETAMDVADSSWSVVYSGGSGDQLHFTGSSAPEGSPDRGGIAAATVTYDPVRPEESSSGTYSGGSPKTTTMDEAAVRRLWELIDACESATDQHATTRAKGTGAFTVTAESSTRRFTLRPGPMLTAFEEFTAPYRGSDHQRESFVGTAQRAKLGPLLTTDDGRSLWIDLPDWPEAALGERVRVEGRFVQREDVPAFVDEGLADSARKIDGPARAGVPVPPGTDLESARTRRVLTDVRWELAD